MTREEAIRTTLPVVDVARHAAAYRLHSHADTDVTRASRHYDALSSRGMTDAFSALANGGHRDLAATLQDESHARAKLRALLDRPDDGTDVTGSALARYVLLRERVTGYLDGLR